MLASGEDGYKLSCSGTSPTYKKRAKKKSLQGVTVIIKSKCFIESQGKRLVSALSHGNVKVSFFFVLGALFGKPVTQKDILEC